MPDTDRDDLLDLAPLYALNAVDQQERAAIEERLTRADAPLAARFADAVDRTHDVLGELSLVDAVPPPPELEGRLLAALDQLQPGGVRDIRSARRFSGKQLGWLATAAAVLVAALVGGAVLAGRDAGSPDQRITAATVLEQADARAATVAVPSGGSITVNSSSALGAAAISFAAMPELPADRDYQLWIIHPGGDPLPDAVVPGSGEVVAEYTAADTIAVTVEPAGGSQAPSGAPIAAMVMD
ncbi:anti-sigma factor [Nocardia asteroides]|uniref:anti-sigma factor n=1 Tax=Nocardia asteroides TaxID=1824 RepID=UPI001E2F1E1B|nr:anti-sigma factor [Nocardia asteroides]UGT62405.1 anti-sigma factor [Nocardia asteroides]